MNYHIITYGCQMNVSESERVSSLLEGNGLTLSSLYHADVVFFNCCSIRQSAVDRLKARAKKIKKEMPSTTTILIGCVLSTEKSYMESIFDYVFSAQDIENWKLPFIKNKKTKLFDIEPLRKKPIAYISITTGCNNFCSYCVVPYTKGREKHRNYKEVIKEVTVAIKDGYKEIFLIGQNVNSYQGGVNFANLLAMCNQIEGDFWIRFATSHPKDFSDDIISTIKNSNKITRYLHLPVQSGDDDILKKMNRPYTIADYKQIIKKVKEQLPSTAISTDIIVGFPGESRLMFENTRALIEEVGFSAAYIARYSKRAQTTASLFPETVTEKEKIIRERELFSVIEKHRRREAAILVGSVQKVLIVSQNKNGLLLGKTEGNLTVAFGGDAFLVNSFASIKITNYTTWGLKGTLIKN